MGFTLGGGVGILLILGAVVLGAVSMGQILSRVDPGEHLESSAIEERRFLGRIVLHGFLLRALVSLLLHVTEGWSYFGGDEGTFEANGRIFYYYLRGLLPFSIGGNLSARDEIAYPYLVGSLYHLFGLFQAVPLLLNCLLGAGLVYPVHALAGRFGGRDAARRASILVAFFPSLVLWSSLMVRDVWALFFLASALFFADTLRRTFRVTHFVAMASCLAGLAFVRSHVFLIVAVAIAAGLLLGRRSIPKALFTGGLLMAALVLSIRSGSVASGLLEGADLQTLATMRRYNAMGPSVAGSLGADVDISTPAAALSYLPLGLLYFYFSPFPWQIGSPRQVMAVVDLVVWYSIMPGILVGMVWMVRRRFRAVLPLLLAVIGISILYALVEGNIGIIFRHRAQVIVPLCVVAGVGYAVQRRRAARKESLALEGPDALDAAPRGPLRPAPGLRVPSGAP